METATQAAIDFSLSAEQRAIQETARDFARREVDPIVEDYDESGKYPREVMRKAAELGFLGVIFPEEYGGAGLGYVEYVLVVTELSRVDPSVGISVAAHNSLVHQPHLQVRQRRAAPALGRAAGAGREDRAPGRSPSPARVPTPRRRAPRRARSTAAGCSTAPSASAPTARWATSAWCWR